MRCEEVNVMHHPDDSLPDPEIDQMLKTWRQALGSDDLQLQRMRARVQSRLVSMASGGPNLVRSARPASASIRPGLSVAAVMAVLLVLGLTGWLLELPRPEVTLREQTQAAPVAFTASEIRKREELVCELDRVFEHHMLGVYQNGQAVEVDLAEQSLATFEAPTLVMRFVQQQRVGNGALDRARCRDQRLADDLAAIDPLPAHIHRSAAKQIDLDLLEIEGGKQGIDGGGHGARGP